MLALVGLGLEEGDLTLKGRELIEGADEVYVEGYTSFPYRVEARRLSREQVESSFLVERAKAARVVLLVAGDPLFATTHLSLVAEARRAGVPVEIAHAPSVINALARTGLSTYKFGRTVTLSKNFPSDRERISLNLKCNLHTLCLIDPGKPILDALSLLKEMGFSGNWLVAERLGTSSERIHYGPSEKLLQLEYGPPPHAVIIPAELSFFEEEFIKSTAELHT